MRIYVFFLFFFYIKWHKMREWASCSHKRKSSWQNKPLKSGPTPSATLNLSQSHRRPPAWGGGVTERPDSFPPTFTVKRPEWEKQLITLHLKEKLWWRPNMSKWKDRVVRWAKRKPSFFSGYEPSFGRFELLCFEHLSIFPSFAYHHTGSSIDWFPKVHRQFLFHSASAMCTLFILRFISELCILDDHEDAYNERSEMPPPSSQRKCWHEMLRRLHNSTHWGGEYIYII